jgi:hypothetical protein
MVFNQSHLLKNKLHITNWITSNQHGIFSQASNYMIVHSLEVLDLIQSNPTQTEI